MDRGVCTDQRNDGSTDSHETGGADAAPSGVILEVREDFLRAGTGAHGQQDDEEGDEAEYVGCEDKGFDTGESSGEEDIEEDGEGTDENGEEDQLPRLWDIAAVRYNGKTLDGGATDVSCAGNVGLPSQGTEPADEVTENFPQLFGGENGDPMVLFIRVRCVC